MTAIEQLNSYLRRLEIRMRLIVFSRGFALAGAVAFLITTLLVWTANRFEFAPHLIAPMRILLFLGAAAAIAFSVLIPSLRVNRKRVTRLAERRFPDFKERLLTVTERSETGPFRELLTADALRVAHQHEVDEFASRRSLYAFVALATGAVGLLIWIIGFGPGYWGYGASLLWTGAAHAGSRPLYDIAVEPGNKTIRRKSDQLVKAQLLGFAAAKVTIHARYHNGPKWEQTIMQPERSGNGYELLLAGLSDSMDYYVQAGARESRHYTLAVKDLPSVKRVRVVVHYPAQLALKDVVADAGGDVRAVQGSEAEISVQTDRPLERGALLLDDGSQVDLVRAEQNWLTGRLRVKKDGSYHVAALDGRDVVRISDDYVIEAVKDEPPSVRIERPGRDPHVSPIEELPIKVAASDDFGVEGLDLHYSVNGAPEKITPLLKDKNVKEAKGQTTLYLENLKLVPGDVVSFYATARDASKTARTDIVFAQVEPFDYKFRQLQQASSEGIMGQEDSRISERQKEVIAATWNEIKNGAPDRNKAAEEGRFLAEMENKLGGEATTLAKRMGLRDLIDTNPEFQTFSNIMKQAADDMSRAVEELKPGKWQDALSPEQKAFQSLLRAESVFREIQVAFGQSAGRGMGGNPAGRDLAQLLDLELDKTKNQYETGQTASASNEQKQALDKALQRLEMLARRQQELQAQQSKQQPFEQRWQEEQLRREAEQLRQQMEQLAQNQQGQPQQGQAQQGQAQQGQNQQGESGAQEDRQTGNAMRQAANALQRAENEMRRAVSERDGTAEQRASAQLGDAQKFLSNLQRQRLDKSFEELQQRAQQIANAQRESANRLSQLYGRAGIKGRSELQAGASANYGMPEMTDPGMGFGYRRRFWEQIEPVPSRPATEQERAVAADKERIGRQLEQLERDLQAQAQSMSGAQPKASSQLLSALSEAQQQELALRMKKSAEWIRTGYGSKAAGLEESVTRGTEGLSRDLRQVQQALLAGGADERKAQPDQNENARSAAGETAPEQYRDAVAEYFKKLSR